MEVECRICEDKLRDKLVAHDAGWEHFTTRNKKEVYVCRECATIIAQRVIDEY